MQDPAAGFAQLVAQARARRAWLAAPPAGEPDAHAPPEPTALRDGLVAAGAAALPTLIAAVNSPDDVAAEEAIAALDRMGTAAPSVVEALTACLAGGPSPRRARALVALACVDLEAALATGAHRDAEVMAGLQVGDLERRPATLKKLVERVLDEADAAGVLAAIDGKGLSVARLVALGHDDLVPLAALRRRLVEPRAAVRGRAAALLARLGDKADVAPALAALAAGEAPDQDVLARLAPHPGSDALLPAVLRGHRPWPELRLLVARRRAAGMSTDPAPLRAALRAGLAERLPPGGLSSVERERWAALVQLPAWLGDDALVDDLVAFWRQAPALDEECRRALLALGDRGRAAAGDAPPGPTAEAGDDRFIVGRVDELFGGAPSACELYEQALLAEPGAAAPAVMLAWIDRAFGVPIGADRLAHLRALGFPDDALLAELARPPWQALRGPRRQWSTRVPRAAPADDAQRAMDAGLYGLAAALWEQAGQEESADRARRAASDLVARVRDVRPSPGAGSLSPEAATAFAAVGSWVWVESPEGWLLGFATLDGIGPVAWASRVSSPPTVEEAAAVAQRPQHHARFGPGAARWAPVADEQRRALALPPVPPWAWRDRPWLHDPELATSRAPEAPDCVLTLFVGERDAAREWLWVRLDGVDPTAPGYCGLVFEPSALVRPPPRVTVRCAPGTRQPIWFNDTARLNQHRHEAACRRCGCDVHPEARPAGATADASCPVCHGAMRLAAWPPPALLQPTAARGACRRCGASATAVARHQRARAICPVCRDVVIATP